MQAAMLHGPDDLRIDTVSAPQPGPDDVVLRVRACGVCGSDLSYVKAGGVMGPTGQPMPLGHELSGIVEQVGERVTGLQPGQQVVVDPMTSAMIGNGGPDGGFAPHLLVRGARLGGNVFRMPDDMPAEVAALAEPLAVALHAVNRARVQPGQRAVVMGAGPIGLGILLWLRRRGVEDVVVADYSPRRREAALAMGAAEVVDPAETPVAEVLSARHGSEQLFGMLPVVNTELFFEATGVAQVVQDIVVMAPLGATLVVVAVHKAPVALDMQLLLAKELSVLPSMAYPEEFPEVVEALSAGALNVAPMISHRFTFPDVLPALDAARNTRDSVKVMVTFPG